MRAKSILHDLLGKSLNNVHRKRMRTVFLVVEAVIREKCLALTALGRSLARITGVEKHAIKRVDRLFGNTLLLNELTDYFRAIANAIIGTNKVCIILIDWTKIHADLSVLSASIPVGGRSVGIYHEVHPKNLENNRDIHSGFLDTLCEIIPCGCIPIIVTDAGAGFQNPWFKKVTEMGWHYVGRFSCNVLLQVDGLCQWKEASSFWAQAKQNVPFDLGKVAMKRSAPIQSRCIVYKAKPKGRKGHRGSDRKGVHPAMSSYKRCQKRNREPWLLCTSIIDNAASDIVQIYSTRMQCEEFFRDSKSHRFGFGFEDVLTRDPARITIILLLSALAHLVSLLVGRAAEQQGLERHFQANTVKKRRVISQVFLGTRILASIKRWKLSVCIIRSVLPMSYLSCFRRKNLFDFA